MKHNVIIDTIKEQFYKIFGTTNGLIVSIAPGRVNLIGDHTDYSEGLVLPMTIDRAAYVAIRARTDNKCKFYSNNFDEFCEWNLSEISKTEEHDWANYIKGIMQVLKEHGCAISGVDGVVFGNVPIAAGLSSSAALEVATLHGLQHLFNLSLQPLEVIKLAKKAENIFVGVNCGIMDQFVSVLGKKRHALFIDCRTLDYKHIPIDFGDYALLIADTKVKRELAKSAFLAFQECHADCEEALRHLQVLNKDVQALRDVNLEMLDDCRDSLKSLILKRAKHVVSENQRVLDAIKAFANNDILKFGELIRVSQKSLKEDHRVSCKEMDFIVHEAEKSGAIGARLTGAGFGGCGFIVVKKNKMEDLIADIYERYNKSFGFLPSIIQLEEGLESQIVI